MKTMHAKEEVISIVNEGISSGQIPSGGKSVYIHDVVSGGFHFYIQTTRSTAYDSEQLESDFSGYEAHVGKNPKDTIFRMFDSEDGASATYASSTGADVSIIFTDGSNAFTILIAGTDLADATITKLY